MNYYAPVLTQSIIFKLGFIPYELFHFIDVNPKNLVPIPLTIFTAMFMHGGWLHMLSMDQGRVEVSPGLPISVGLLPGWF
ncbi:MAG: hypothetical protein B6I30_10670 [Desulfobacteraceae bacterium 4572_187]|nr:MAG: hypothetical protein B6I30_10670 [Desulfobacteraceae bacterium 4572_187]